MFHWILWNVLELVYVRTDGPWNLTEFHGILKVSLNLAPAPNSTESIYPIEKFHGIRWNHNDFMELGAETNSMELHGILWNRHPYPDCRVHGANMGSTWVLSVPDGPHVGPMNLVIRVEI